MPTRVPFSQKPGRHERHFIRRLDNPLFPRPVNDYTDEDLLEVQRLDHEELLVFLMDLRQLIQQTAELKPNVESQVILDLKSDLDQTYEKACTMADEQEANKDALSQLINAIMNTVKIAAGNDAKAQQELADEERARANHFRLLGQVVVADLLDPDSLIQEDELIATLFTESDEGYTAALELFDDEQKKILADRAAHQVQLFDLPDTSWQKRIAQLLQG